MKTAVIFAATLLVALPAMSQNCAEFDTAIEDSLKRIAALYADGNSDDSAPRQTNRNTERLSEIQLILVNQNYAATNKCPPRKRPIRRNMYKESALACKLALLRSEDTEQVCNTDNWKP